MSVAAAETVEDGEAPPPPAKRGRKKLIVLATMALLVVAVLGGAAAFVVKKRAAAAAALAGDEAPAQVSFTEARKAASKNPPTFLPLDPFIVNLADLDTERFAQIGITLELSDAKFADELKAYMPAIRNGILMVMAHKTAKQLMGRAGKEALAREIMREALRPLGMELDEHELAARTDDEYEDDEAPAAHTQATDPNPLRRVHFSSFIIQ